MTVDDLDVVADRPTVNMRANHFLRKLFHEIRPNGSDQFDRAAITYQMDLSQFTIATFIESLAAPVKRWIVGANPRYCRGRWRGTFAKMTACGERRGGW